MVGFVLREDRTGNRFYDHELTKIINPDSLNTGAFSSEEGVALVARANRGDVMNILRDRLGVNDGTGQVLFQARESGGIPANTWFLRQLKKNASSPRPWGCFLLDKSKLTNFIVFPTPVGVFRLLP